MKRSATISADQNPTSVTIRAACLLSVHNGYALPALINRAASMFPGLLIHRFPARSLVR